MISEINADTSFAGTLFSLSFMALQAPSSTFFIGTIKPIIRLSTVLAPKLMRNCVISNLSADTIEFVSERQKLMVTPISTLMMIPTFFIYISP